MESKFNFKSSICTSRVQSERLLALGLKKETADMVLLKEMIYDEENHCTKDGEGYLIRPIDYLEGEKHRGHIPAWSLHRLMSMLTVKRKYLLIRVGADLYDVLIDKIEHEIKVDNFNKDYLEE